MSREFENRTQSEAERGRSPSSASEEKPGALTLAAEPVNTEVTGADPASTLDLFPSPWKAHLLTRAGYSHEKPAEPSLLFDLEQDASERYDVAASHPKVVADLLREVERHRAGCGPAPSRLGLRSVRY